MKHPGIQGLLASYPRTRPELPPAQRARYVQDYRNNRMGAQGLAAVVAGLEAWMHRAVAAPPAARRILELGAGTLNHLRYEPEAEVYDVVEPFHELWVDRAERGRVGRFYDDIAEVPEAARYDRIVSIAVLEHLTDLPLVVARSALHLDEGGQFRGGIPSEGGFLWGLAWRSTTGVVYRLRTGLDYARIMRHEHANQADEIVAVLGYFFQEVSWRRFPLGVKHLSFYTAIEARGPRRERCAAFADGRRVLVPA